MPECANNIDVARHTIPEKYYHAICYVCRNFNVFSLTYNDTGVLCENDTDEYVHKEAYNNGILIVRVKSLEDAVCESVVKFMIVGEPDELLRAEPWVKKVTDGELNVFYSEPYFMEITPKGIEKASELRKLTEFLGYSCENVMAIGDGLNDIPMLKYAGLSVAVDNVYDEAKKCAAYVVSSNEENGVAEAIDRFICRENLR